MGVLGHRRMRRQEFVSDDDNDDDYKLPISTTPSINMIQNDQTTKSIDQGILKTIGSK